MYVGHLSVALAAARMSKRPVPLWCLVLASQGPDWISVGVGALGISDPWEYWSHSLPAVALGVLGIGVVAWLRTGDARITALLGGAYLTHPLFDLLTGLKPTWPGGALVGACLYDWPVGDFLVEIAFVVAGLLIYRRTLRGRAAVTVPVLMLMALVVCQAGADGVQSYRRRMQLRSGHVTTSFPVCRTAIPAGERDSPRRGR